MSESMNDTSGILARMLAASGEAVGAAELPKSPNPSSAPPALPKSPNPSSSLGSLEPLVPLGPLVLVAGAAPRLFKIWALRSVGSVEGVAEDPYGAKAAAGVDDG